VREATVTIEVAYVVVASTQEAAAGFRRCLPAVACDHCHTPFRDSRNEASIRVPRIFNSHV
jgi:hypothetical protein